MSQVQSDSLTPLQRALYEIRSLRNRLTELEKDRNEPIAIVGMGLRFPGGATSPSTFWKLLESGTDTTGEIPPGRWSIDRYYDPDPDARGKMYTRHGAFLTEPEAFDADFFGISPREAMVIDPQHRIALEIAWEALENAGYNPSGLAGSPAGVFLALSNSDYSRTVFGQTDNLDAYASTGNLFSAAAGRISYTLGLQGPSLVVDTACSGSLVAIHLACKSLRLGECSMALAGGVNLILSPEVNINFSKSRMMAPDGKCKTFDAAADGYVRGEGCGMVVLKRAFDALRDGDNILALVRGSAVNQDGRSSSLTVPSGLAQQSLLRQALADARLGPGEIDYIEAHGTGTALGDPIEAHAIADVFGGSHSGQNPLLLGSVKTNLGHLEAAAGIAGIIKTTLSLQNQCIPPALHFRSLNPHINWGDLSVEIPTQLRPWPKGERPRRAGVSSFGFSGTNAHIVLEEAPQPEPRFPEWRREWHILTASARTETGLDSLSAQYQQYLAASTKDLGDVCFTANAGRSNLRHRIAYIGRNRTEMIEPAARGTSDAAAPIAFLFSGQGAQFAGMGSELYRTHPVFHRAVVECEEILRDELPHSLTDVLWGSRTNLLAQTEYTQPALFAIEWALAQLWRSWGIEPAAVAGHSVGEYVAACVAGVWGLEAGLRLIAARGRLMQRCAGQGVMTAVRATEKKALHALRGLESRVSLAAVNGPQSVVIAGYESEVSMAEDRLLRDVVQVKRLHVSHAFHSPQMEEMQAEFAQIARSCKCENPSLTWISSMTGNAVEFVDAEYWRAQVRQPVRWADAMASLDRATGGIYLEVGPGSTLTQLGMQCVPSADRLWLSSLRSDCPEWKQVLETVGRMYVRGTEVDWKALDQGYQRRRVPMPTYPFERRSYWIETAQSSKSEMNPAAEWSSINESVLRQAGHGTLDLDISSYPQRWAILDELTTQYICRAFQKLGLFRSAGDRQSSGTLLESKGIRPVYGKLMERWLRQLAVNGRLVADGDGYIAPRPVSSHGLDELIAGPASQFSHDPIFEYCHACGEVLAEVLTGELAALETLFPGGDIRRAEDIYERAPMSAYFGSLARAALESIVRARPTGALRVLELGAGTGATAVALLPVCPPDRTTYHFTDISDSFLRYGERKFADYPFVRYHRLDIEQDGVAQGCVPESFDVVVATNVLHATRDLRRTLENTKGLLAPGGILILCEVTEYHSWLDMTIALIEGWQLFEDGLRTDHPLLPVDQWDRLLVEAGFERVEYYPQAGSPAVALGRHALIARKAGVAGSKPFVPEHQGASAVASKTPQPQFDREWELAGASSEERREFLVALIREHLCEMLRFDSPQRIDRRRRFMELGIDSLMAVEFRNRLGASLHLEKPLSATLVFDHPTVEALVDHLERDVLSGRSDEEITQPAPETASSNDFRNADQIAAMDDDEVEALLLARLQSM